MGKTLEVEVLLGVGHIDQSEAQEHCREAVFGGSAERSRGSTYRNRMRGAVDQGERAANREALVAKGWRRISGDRADLPPAANGPILPVEVGYDSLPCAGRTGTAQTHSRHGLSAHPTLVANLKAQGSPSRPTRSALRPARSPPARTRPELPAVLSALAGRSVVVRWAAVRALGRAGLEFNRWVSFSTSSGTLQSRSLGLPGEGGNHLRASRRCGVAVGEARGDQGHFR